MTERQKVIIDCDPGYDDAVALLFAGGSKALKVLSVTTVAGNRPLECVTKNARRLVAAAGLSDISVSAGADKPLCRETWTTAADVHGESGLDGVDLPKGEASLDDLPAAERIVDILMKEPAGTVTLIPIGPLTNIARALEIEPRIEGRVKEVVLMGGAFRQGNITRSAEFNIYTDPEAAKIVFNAQWRLTMIGLDLTHQALVTPEVLAKAKKLHSKAGKVFYDILYHFSESYRKRGFTGGAPLHDACAVAFAINPALIETVAVPIDVETRGELTLGMTVPDLRGKTSEIPRTRAGIKLDRRRFWETLLEAIGNLR